MEPLVSVIITDTSEKMYLVRCINSIMRQNHKHTEIFIGGDCKELEEIITDQNLVIFDNTKDDKWEKLNKIINGARGKYIFFCDGTSLFSNSLLTDMVSKADKNLVIAEKCAMTENQMQAKIFDELSITGKLFDVEILRDAQISFEGNVLCPEYDFITKYIGACSEIIYCESGVLYENADRIFVKFNEDADYSEYESTILKLEETWIPEECLEDFILKMFENIENNEKIGVEKSFYMVKLAQSVMTVFGNTPGVNYKIADRFLRNLFEECRETKDAFVWIEFQKYFSAIKNMDILRSLLAVYGLDMQKVYLLNKYSVEEYEAYESISREESTITIDNSEVLDAISSLSEKIDRLERLGNVTNVVYQEKYLSGTELGEYVLEEYKAGRMGVKYIGKFLMAWIKHKFSK